MEKPSFTVVAMTNREYLCKFARSLRLPEDEVQDLVQDTLVTGFERWPTFEARSSPQAWLCGILLHLLLNRWRRSKRYRQKLERYAASLDSHDYHDSEPPFTPAEIKEFLATLEEAMRVVFVMCELEGYTGREVAEKLSINPNTVASRLRAARLALRRYFRDRHNWAVLLLWSGPSVIGGFCKGFVGAMAVAFWVMSTQPLDDEILDEDEDDGPLLAPAKAFLPGTIDAPSSLFAHGGFDMNARVSTTSAQHEYV